MMSLRALQIGFLLDLLLGDPKGYPHLVVGMGKMITWSEKGLRRLFPKTPKGETLGGIILILLVPGISCSIAWGVLYLCNFVHPFLRLMVESLICWQCLALRSLGEAGKNVYRVLAQNHLIAARLAVSQIVGRDTGRLDASGVTRATVETVAENAGDGVIAPMLFMIVGGGLFGVLYKAINTMDSMVGYKNQRYIYFGRAAAGLDDAANFVPARIAGLLTVFSSFFVKLDGRNAWRIFWRDRYNHSSPNSGQLEAAYAGALHVQLGGDAFYFGELVHKPTLGDNHRLIAPVDICRATRLLYCTSLICLLLCSVVKGLILWF